MKNLLRTVLKPESVKCAMRFSHIFLRRLTLLKLLRVNLSKEQYFLIYDLDMERASKFQRNLVLLSWISRII